MARRSEEIRVGSMVIVSVLVFLAALVFVGGVNVLRQKKKSYTTYLKFAGGLEPGTLVRFGGLKVGSVTKSELDPRDSTRIRIQLQVAEHTPVRTNSKARISALGFLGENYLEISPGTSNAELLPAGNEIPSEETAQLPEILNNANALTMNANLLVRDVGDKLIALTNDANQLVNNLNTMTGPQAQRHLDAILANLDSLIAETRPPLKQTLANMEGTSSKLSPVIDQVGGTLKHADTLTQDLNTVVVENRAEIHEALIRLRDSLAEAQHLMVNLDDTLAGDRDNLDETLDNVRVTTQNLKEFTDILKRRPYSLIRVKEEKDRVPPVGK